MSITESERAYRQRSEVKKRNSEWFAKYYAENKERLNRRTRELYNSSPERRLKVKIRNKKYRNNNVEKARIAETKNTNRLKSEVYDLLGRKCAKCGFDNPKALQIDHINGGGAEELIKLSNSRNQFYRKILRENGKGYQILCANCNWIKRVDNREYRKNYS